MTIGVVVPRQTDTVMAMLYKALARACGRSGQFAITDDESGADRAAAETLLHRGVDGPALGHLRRKVAVGPRRRYPAWIVGSTFGIDSGAEAAEALMRLAAAPTAIFAVTTTPPSVPSRRCAAPTLRSPRTSRSSATTTSRLWRGAQ